MGTQVGHEARLVELVSRYSSSVRGAVLAQHDGASVYSPIGIWLLLSATVLAADGEERELLERAIGCGREEAQRLLRTFLADVPPAFNAAIALWARAEITTETFDQWVASLPAAVGTGPIPTQAEADSWADRETRGLIANFPARMDEMVLVLASAVATRVSWESAFEIAPARERFPATSPWHDVVEHVLSTEVVSGAAIVESVAAGPVAVFEAAAKEDLVVICISADPTVPRDRVLTAAHEVAAHIPGDTQLNGRSLFDLPLGDGHSWTIAEADVPAWHPGQRFEAIVDAALPAWTIKSDLNLLASHAFAADTATAVLNRMLTSGGPPDATQVALANFDRYGFEAAAITLLGVAAGAMVHPTETGLRRTASLRFDHPFAALAVSGGTYRRDATHFRGLPLFEAWIDSPTEPEAPRDLEPSLG